MQMMSGKKHDRVVFQRAQSIWMIQIRVSLQINKIHKDARLRQPLSHSKSQQVKLVDSLPKNKAQNSPFTKRNLLKGTRLSDEPDTFSLDKIEKQIVISKLYHLNYDPKLLTDRNRASIVNMLGRE